jgi:hypothetical protein
LPVAVNKPLTFWADSSFAIEILPQAEIGIFQAKIGARADRKIFARNTRMLPPQQRSSLKLTRLNGVSCEAVGRTWTMNTARAFAPV